MNKRRLEQYPDFIARLYPELCKEKQEHVTRDNERMLPRSVTFQVTDKCNLACKYCYQINKGSRRMSLKTAKKFIDLLLTGEKGMDTYINPETSPAIILDFIGGEPLLEIELIDQIVDYFRAKSIELNSPWADKFMISLCSNGVLFKDPRVQRFLLKNLRRLSFSVTIDGNKELHDSCRIFPNGEGSYDLAVEAAKSWMARGYYMGSKLTIAPENLQYLTDAFRHMISLGYYDINANCVYEKGWNQEHSVLFYKKLKEVADILLENSKKDIYCSLFEETFFRPKKPTDLQNWCGGNGMMIALDPDGYIYPCLRYMESSLGCEQKPVRIGDVDNGVGTTCDYEDCINCVCNIDRKSQSTDECFYCPVAEGCSWCQAYNYQDSGNFHTRATYICEMHKARALANVYYWNKFYEKEGLRKAFKMYLPKEWALKIIPEEEYDYLLKLSTDRINQGFDVVNQAPEGAMEATESFYKGRY